MIEMDRFAVVFDFVILLCRCQAILEIFNFFAVYLNGVLRILYAGIVFCFFGF